MRRDLDELLEALKKATGFQRVGDRIFVFAPSSVWAIKAADEVFG